MAAVNRRFIPLPDCANRDPFRGLLPGYPTGHSRFPLVPVDAYGDLSFDPSSVQNGPTEETDAVKANEQRRRWREAVQQALGNFVEIYLDEDPRG